MPEVRGAPRACRERVLVAVHVDRVHRNVTRLLDQVTRIERLGAWTFVTWSILLVGLRVGLDLDVGISSNDRTTAPAAGVVERMAPLGTVTGSAG